MFANILNKKPNLNTDSITNFNTMQLSIFFNSNIDKYQLYAK